MGTPALSQLLLQLCFGALDVLKAEEKQTQNGTEASADPSGIQVGVLGALDHSNRTSLHPVGERLLQDRIRISLPSSKPEGWGSESSSAASTRSFSSHGSFADRNVGVYQNLTHTHTHTHREYDAQSHPKSTATKVIRSNETKNLTRSFMGA